MKIKNVTLVTFIFSFLFLLPIHAEPAEDVICLSCVDTTDIAPSAITSGRIAPEAVTSTRIAPNAITSGRIMDGQVMNRDISDNAVSGSKLDQTLADTINTLVSDVEELKTGINLPIGSTKGDILFWDGSAWKLSPAPPTNALIAPPVLTLCDGVPMWLSSPCVAAGGYKIGDIGPSGGIVFYTTELGLHGLEAATANVSNSATWGCSGLNISGADGVEIGTGAQNTADIISGCSEVDTAAKLATTYISETGLSGWHLPSKDELDLLYEQKDLFSDLLENNYFWSSTEYNDNTAWFQYIFNGGKSYYDKVFQLRVRAVKSF